jgi:hypothetical protein
VGQFGERGFLDGRDGGKRSIESHSRAGSFFGKKRILRVYHHTNALVWWYIALEKIRPTMREGVVGLREPKAPFNASIQKGPSWGDLEETRRTGLKPRRLPGRERGKR